MEKMVYQWQITTDVNIYSYEKPIKATPLNILRAMSELTAKEFKLWVRLCEFSLDLDPMCLKGIEVDFLKRR